MDFVQQAVAQSHDSDFSAGTFVGVDFLAEPLSSVGHANILRIFPACRYHCWRRLPRRAFVLRRGTPTFSGFFRPARIIVGVRLLAKPLSSVEARQHSPDFPGPPESLLASTSSQSLYLPSGHANLLRIFPTCRRHCWRRLPRKVSILRRGTPICSGFSRLAGNLCRPRTAITAKSLTVMAGFF